MVKRLSATGAAAWFASALFAASPSFALSPEGLLIYYAYPSSINLTFDNALAADEFGQYEFVVLGDTLEKVSHPDHANMVAILAEPAMSATTTFGYIDLGVSTQNLPLAEVQLRVDEWLATGADGIFFDDFGYDFLTDRARQNAAVDYAHAQGMPVIANGFFVDDVFSPAVHATYNPSGLSTSLTADDFYLYESHQVQLGTPLSAATWQAKANALDAYQALMGFDVLSITTPDGVGTYDENLFFYSWHSALMYGHRATGWGEPSFSSMDALAPLRARPIVHPGTTFLSAANNADPIYSRDTDEGQIVVDTGTISAEFLANPGSIPQLTQWLAYRQVPNTAVPTPAQSASGLVISYDTPPGHTLENLSYIYDDALAVIAWALEDRCSEAAAALESVAGLIESNGSLPFVSNVVTGSTAAFYRTGAIAWAGYSFLLYQQLCDDDQFQADALEVVDWVLTMQDVTLRSVKGGPDVSWFSTEHNIDAYFLFRDAGLISGNAAYTTAAKEIKQSLLTNHWNAGYDCFQQGIGDTAMALDTGSWGAMFLRAIGDLAGAAACMAFVEANFTTSKSCVIDSVPKTIAAYKPYPATDLAWSEGSLGVAMAYERSGDATKAAEVLDEIDKMHVSNAGVVYACPEMVDFAELESVAGSAWRVMAGSAQRPSFWSRDPQTSIGYKAKAAKTAGNTLAKGYNINIDDILLDDTAPDDPENYEIGKTKGLAVTGSDVQQVRYKIKAAREGAGEANESGDYPKAVRHTGRRWDLENELGTITVNSRKVLALLAPATLDLAAPPAPFAADETNAVCYRVKLDKSVASDQAPTARLRDGLQVFATDVFDDCAADSAFVTTPAEGRCLYNLSGPAELCSPTALNDVEASRTTNAAPGTSSRPARSGQVVLCYKARLARELVGPEAAAVAGLPIGTDAGSQTRHTKRATVHVAPSGIPAPLTVGTSKRTTVCLPSSVLAVQ
jgi:hypothetical protein